MPNEPKLRGAGKQRNGPWPLGEIPHTTVTEIGKHIVHRLAVGQVDITGDDFGGIFATAISGIHRGKPLGIADVEWENCAWSVKTMKAKNPFTETRIRAISGRNDVNFSYDIKDPYADIAATGKGVLDIWNARVNESLNQHDDLRILVLARNMDTLEFTLCEYEAVRYIPSEYRWEKNANNNLIGYDIQHGDHRFTWQAGGRQFTVIHHIPASAYRFRIAHRPGVLEERHVLNLIKWEDNWIQAVPAPSIIPIQQTGTL